VDELRRLHDEQEQLLWRVAYHNGYSKEVEAHYRARFVRELERRGLGPVAVAQPNDPVDLFVAGHAVELKVAREGKHPYSETKRRFQGLLRDPGNRHRLNGDLVVLLCVDRDDRLWPYVIPRLLLGNRRTVEVTSHPRDYRGQWAPFLEAYDYLAPSI
jgi:hypothetical protein